MKVSVGIKCSGSKISGGRKMTQLVPYKQGWQDLSRNLKVFLQKIQLVKIFFVRD